MPASRLPAAARRTGDFRTFAEHLLVHPAWSGVLNRAECKTAACPFAIAGRANNAMW